MAKNLVVPGQSSSRRRTGGIEGAEFRSAEDMGVTRVSKPAAAAQVSLFVKNKEVAVRTARITNRGELGRIKEWYAVFNGETYPDDLDTSDKSTWVQPGQSIVVPIEVALHVCGNFLSKEISFEREVMASRFGGWQYEGTERGKQGQSRDMTILGPPVLAPDLVVEIQSDRGETVAGPISIYEHYFLGDAEVLFSERNNPATKERDEKEISDRLKKYRPV